MAGIVKGMFGPTPEELQAENQQMRQEMLARFAQQGGASSLGGALGVGLGMGINKLFGLEDPRLTKSTTIAKTLQDIQQELGTDATDPIKLYSTVADKMNALGYSDEASIALQQLTAAKDKERSYALEERKVIAAEATSKATLQDKVDKRNNDQLNFITKRHDAEVKQLEKSYDDPESMSSQAANAWASGFDSKGLTKFSVDDPSVLASAFKELHLNLTSMKRLTENGNVIPLFSTAAAAAKAREILGTRGEDGELLYIDKGNWNPFKGTSVGIPSDVLSTIQSNLYAETGAVPPDTTSEASSVTEKAPAITQEEYNALKSGMEYTAPDGSKRIKK